MTNGTNKKNNNGWTLRTAWMLISLIVILTGMTLKHHRGGATISFTAEYGVEFYQFSPVTLGFAMELLELGGH